jgi:hypothetical protein
VYRLSVEEQRRYDGLKARVFTPGMNMRRFLLLEEFNALPKGVRDNLVSDVVRMMNSGELNGRQFMNEMP